MQLKRIVDYVNLFLSAEGIKGKFLVLKGINRAISGKLTGTGGFFYLEEPITIRKHGLYIYTPKNDISIASVKLDSKDNDVLKKVLSILNSSKKTYFLDIGANIGSISLLTASSARNKTIVAIEPIPWLADSINKSKIRNGFNNLVVVHSAISTKKSLNLEVPKSGKAYFTTVASSAGRYDKIPEKYLTHENFNVPVNSLDFLINKLGISPNDIALIKIDVEGAEADALYSGIKSLRAGKPPIIFEIWGEEKLEEVKSVLNKAGYTRYEQLDESDYIAF